MNTATKILGRLAGTFTLAAVIACQAVCAAGPLGGIAHKVGPGRTDGPHAPGLSLAAVRTNLGLVAHPQPLDTPRQPVVNLHESRDRPDAMDDERNEGLHNPRGLHWQDGSAPISPTLVSLARNYHREGLPVVRLWQADRNMVSIGLNPHGVPGIYFTQKMGR
jgi:hypothetical protein